MNNIEKRIYQLMKEHKAKAESKENEQYDIQHSISKWVDIYILIKNMSYREYMDNINEVRKLIFGNTCGLCHLNEKYYEWNGEINFSECKYCPLQSLTGLICGERKSIWNKITISMRKPYLDLKINIFFHRRKLLKLIDKMIDNLWDCYWEF